MKIPYQTPSAHLSPVNVTSAAIEQLAALLLRFGEIDKSITEIIDRIRDEEIRFHRNCFQLDNAAADSLLNDGSINAERHEAILREAREHLVSNSIESVARSSRAQQMATRFLEDLFSILNAAVAKVGSKR